MKESLTTLCGAIVGGFAGAALGLAFPMGLAAAYVRSGGDPSAAGALSFLAIVTLPIGVRLGRWIGIGVAVLVNEMRTRETPKHTRRRP